MVNVLQASMAPVRQMILQSLARRDYVDSYKCRSVRWQTMRGVQYVADTRYRNYRGRFVIEDSRPKICGRCIAS